MAGLARAAPPSYLGREMASFPWPSSPRAVLRDLKAFFGGERRHRLPFALLAIAMPVIIVYGFYLDGNTNIMPPRSVIYVQNYASDRTDEEIKAQQKIDQAIKEAGMRERQRQFQELEKRLGM